MTGGSNKYRVFVALYFRQGITSNPERSQQHGFARFHWAIWVEPKRSDGTGTFFEATYAEAMNSATGPIPAGWQFNWRNANMLNSNAAIGRIMIGKLPEGIGPADVRDVLEQHVPLPSESRNENCVTWTYNAIAELQRRGWVEDFDIDELLQFANDQALEWFESGRWQRAGHKSNFVTNRKFP